MRWFSRRAIESVIVNLTVGTSSSSIPEGSGCHGDGGLMGTGEDGEGANGGDGGAGGRLGGDGGGLVATTSCTVSIAKPSL